MQNSSRDARAQNSMCPLFSITPFVPRGQKSVDHPAYVTRRTVSRRQTVMFNISPKLRFGGLPAQIHLTIHPPYELGIHPELDAALTHFQTMTVEQLETLAEALLDFTEIGDLTTWLREHSR